MFCLHLQFLHAELFFFFEALEAQEIVDIIEINFRASCMRSQKLVGQCHNPSRPIHKEINGFPAASIRRGIRLFFLCKVITYLLCKQLIDLDSIILSLCYPGKFNVLAAGVGFAFLLMVLVSVLAVCVCIGGRLRNANPVRKLSIPSRSCPFSLQSTNLIFSSCNVWRL